jgi:hypothetical protein
MTFSIGTGGRFGDAFSSIPPDAGDLHFQLVLELSEAVRI